MTKSTREQQPKGKKTKVPTLVNNGIITQLTIPNEDAKKQQ
ncbi:17850_t:CDS:2 [Gigaspora margarita]|uniref:17850_t:CDS:1 n=1 Tax=Gigaspora margarita TaxID=4874 RepID=A0ABN7UVD7_GIGMA|nr:17850_t:CDS:2 [Gigaspora margarita]